jgi:hypothetical protein
MTYGLIFRRNFSDSCKNLQDVKEGTWNYYGAQNQETKNFTPWSQHTFSVLLFAVNNKDKFLVNP